MALTIQMVTDNNDNSLTITGVDIDGTSYTTSMGRKSDLPTGNTAQMKYYQDILATALPPEQPVLFQAPGYQPPVDTPVEASTTDTPVAT